MKILSRAKTLTVELLKPLDIAPTSRLADAYTSNDAFGAQKKYDGVRLVVDYDGRQTVGYNRKGQMVELRSPIIADALRKNGIPMKLDGEWLAETKQYVVFDVLSMEGQDTTADQYRVRHAFAKKFAPKSFVVAPLAIGTKAKMDLLQSQIAEGGEGIVYKKLVAGYMPGRVGVNRKRKLWKSATCRVAAKSVLDGKNSFAVEVQKNGRWIGLGTVSAIGKGAIKVGEFREIKYLYLGVNNHLVQPEDLGSRNDVDASDASFAQLQAKQSADKAA